MHHLTDVSGTILTGKVCAQCENTNAAITWAVDGVFMCDPCYQASYFDHSPCIHPGCNVHDNHLTNGLCDEHLETNLGHSPEPFEDNL